MTIHDALQFHPNQYFKLEEPLIIYVTLEERRLRKKEQNKSNPITDTQYQIIREELSKRKAPLIISARHITKGDFWAYNLQMPTFSLNLNMAMGEQNFAVSNFRTGEDGKNPFYNSRYNTMFLLESSKGIYLVHQSKSWFLSPEGTCEEVPESEHLSWHMDEEVYAKLVDQMRSYCEGEDAYVTSPHVSDLMRENVIEPFEQYTEKEHEFELRQVDFTLGVKFADWEAGADSSGKRSSFSFISCDSSADPENCILTVGQQVVIYREDQSSTGLVGLLVEIDTETVDGVIFTLEFYRQFDIDQLPKEGYLFVFQNDTQHKIRKAVARSIYSGKTPARYMYKTFRDYSVAGYIKRKEPEKLVEFLHQRMAQKYPPNLMQLEAIVKGILTEDMLLVLGPPGTGKTTVILAWVEYFVSQNMRVLISSQNNSAVDNVLVRLKGDCEIVRLGREEKIQENCKRFIPSRRIETMRNAVEKNRERLASQIARDKEQISNYLVALRSLYMMLMRRDATVNELEKKSRELKETAALIAACALKMQQARTQLDFYRSRSERYAIFLEESGKKNFFVRLLQAPLRRRAEKRIKEGSAVITENEILLTQKEQEYTKSVKRLQELLQQMRRTGLVEAIEQSEHGIKNLQQRILKGVDGQPRLVPAFESELRYLGRDKSLHADLNSTDFIKSEIERMEQTAISADKILEAFRHWAETALSDDRNDIFEEILLDACKVVGATCIGINANKRFADMNFDVAIIDESGQIQLHNALVPMSRAPKTLMLGDYKQIPPIVNDEIVTSCRNDEIRTDLFTQSFFEFLFRQMRGREIARLVDNPGTWVKSEPGEDAPEIDEERLLEMAEKEILKPTVPDYCGEPIEEKHPGADGKEETAYFSRYDHEALETFIGKIIGDQKKIVNLNSQFRMPGHISDVISQWFYEDNYKSSYDMKNFRVVVPYTDLPLVLIDTSRLPDRFESQPKSKMGYQNVVEADMVADILEAVMQSMSEEKQLEYRRELGERLGVISAYGAQVRLIREKLRQRLHFSNEEASTSVASLDSFQGQERDLIIYSLTRSDRKNPEAARVGFLKELRRLNVAFTRSKMQLVIIGDFTYLQSCLYVKNPEGEALPCCDTDDTTIEPFHAKQCANCELDCERRFSRFFKLLMQHVTADKPAGNLLDAVQFRKILKGDSGHAE
ncbi:MAG: hypothetical protein E7470_08750 [Ruminococcaceae bacterium]|nr:hypothetical protein [Oscillospiraceae bacterium]